MSVHRFAPRLVFLAAALIVSACAGATSATSSPAGGGASGAASTGPAAATPAQPAGGATADPGAASNPIIADGTFTTGKFHADIHGDVTLTVDAPLQGGISVTAAGSTVLSFIDPKSGTGGGLSLSPEGNAVTISSPQVTTAGTSAAVGGAGCTITVSTSDASRVAGTFDCHGLAGIVVASRKNVTVDMQGTFEATR
ncbi:MAG TPA: hypothetical protein VGC90_04675 [Candidatus Limnocylindrales bacterium]